MLSISSTVAMPDTKAATFVMLRVERLALFQRQILGIVDPAREFVAVEDAGRGDDRARERSAAGLVDAGKRLREIQLDLEGAAARHRL